MASQPNAPLPPPTPMPPMPANPAPKPSGYDMPDWATPQGGPGDTPYVHVPNPTPQPPAPETKPTPLPVPRPPTRVTTTETTGRGSSSGAFVLGFSLLIASGITSGMLKDVLVMIKDKGTPTAATTEKDHKQIMWFLGEVLFVIILTGIAGANSEASKAIVAFFIVLWLVFGMSNNVRVNGFVAALTPGMK